MKSYLTLLAAASVLASTAVAAAEELSRGTIKKIDVAGQRVTIAHGPIKNLGMMPMTMTFKVKEPALIKAVSVGDEVRFRVEMVDGDYTVVRIEPAK
ncbi:MAG: copper-binding protein [Rhodocyclaceae bacterium]